MLPVWHSTDLKFGVARHSTCSQHTTIYFIGSGIIENISLAVGIYGHLVYKLRYRYIRFGSRHLEFLNSVCTANHQQVSSKSTANPLCRQQIYSKSTAFCHQLICLQHLDVSICCRQICCVASKSVRYGSERTNLQQVYSMLATCCRQIRCVASKSTANLQQIREAWFDLN